MDAATDNGTASSSNTFSLDVSGSGGIKLKHAVKAKLSEFMGSYTDDVLAEYVVVLVGHGKRQAQAIVDLEAFLGDQSKAFVQWLWDHLLENRSSYFSEPSPQQVEENSGGRAKSSKEVRAEIENSSLKQGGLSRTLAQTSEAVSTDLATKVTKSSVQHTSSRGQREPELRGSSGRDKLVINSLKTGSDQPVNSDVHASREQQRISDGKRTRSPEPWSRRGRGRVEEIKNHQQSDASPPRVKASRRLLESAVRDAVAPSALVNISGVASRRIESGSKRLRSVVSADVESADISADINGRLPPPKPRLEKHGAKVSPAMAVALKAAAAAAEDVNNSVVKGKGRPVGSVWNRLGNRTSETFGMKDADDEETMPDQMDERWVDNKLQGIEDGQVIKRKWRKMSDNLPKAEREDGAGNAAPVDESLDAHGHKGKKIIENLRPGSAGQPGHVEASEGQLGDAVAHKDNLLPRYPTARDSEGRSPQLAKDATVVESRRSFRNRTTEVASQSVVSMVGGLVNSFEKIPSSHGNSQSIASIAAKNNDVLEKPTSVTTATIDTNDVLEMRKRMRQVQLEMTKLRAKQAEASKEVQKAVNTPISGLKARLQTVQEGIDQYSVCVNNVHFAATKEAIAAHFSGCGEVVRVTVLTDATTGKPKGSAYVEFSSKDSVEKAVNLNDSWLLSRTLKVVRKDSSELILSTTARPLHMPPLLSVRMPSSGKFLRGPLHVPRRSAGLSRPFSGTPHLQWKRETSGSNGANGSASFTHTSVSVLSPGGAQSTLRSSNSSLLGDRYGFGPVRLSRSLSYVRPTPYIPREITSNVQEQKVAN